MEEDEDELQPIAPRHHDASTSPAGAFELPIQTSFPYLEHGDDTAY
jgi:hypothetical protein